MNLLEAVAYQREATERCIELLAKTEAELARWLAVIPKCSWAGCNKLGTKWISRQVCNCDDHGAAFLPDVPWAELARERNAR